MKELTRAVYVAIYRLHEKHENAHTQDEWDRMMLEADEVYKQFKGTECQQLFTELFTAMANKVCERRK